MPAIAIVGLSSLFPNSTTPSEFFENLCKGYDGMSRDPRPDALFPGLSDLQKAQQDTLRRGGFIQFTPSLLTTLGMNPNAASKIELSQQLGFEMGWKACLDAGIKLPSSNALPISVISTRSPILGSPQFSKDDRYESAAVYSSGLTASHLSYHGNFTGPSFGIDTACSSFITALWLACQQLQTFETDCAVVISTHLISPGGVMMLHRDGQLSPDGITRPFDRNANGYVFGEGGGAVVLKRLSDLAPDEKHYGIIAGISTMQNGRSNGLGAFLPTIQKQAWQTALTRAGVPAKSVTYVEAHGTATPLGDAMELRVLGDVFRDESRPLLVGSVKGNIGHLDGASGFASLAKCLGIFKSGIVPKTLHHESPNTYINPESLGLKIPTENEKWTGGLIGITALSFGGSVGQLLIAPPLWKINSSSQTTALQTPQPPILPHDSSISDHIQKRLSDWLGLETVAIDQPFFQLGLQSSDLVTLLSELSTFFKSELPLTLGFDHPTIEQLAHAISALKPQHSFSPNLHLDSETVPMTERQRRWFIDSQREGPYPLHLSIQFESHIDKERIQKTVETLIARHDMCRMGWDPDKKQWTSKTSMPAIRVTLSLESTEQRLDIHSDHMAIDGLSVLRLCKECVELYLGHSLPDPVSYAHFQQWESHWLQSNDCCQSKLFWETFLKDSQRFYSQLFTGSSSFSKTWIPKEKSDDIQAKAQFHGVSILTLMLTEFSRSCHEHYDVQNIMVATPVSGRPLSELAHVVGCCHNTILLPLSYQSDYVKHVESTSKLFSEALQFLNYPLIRVAEFLSQRDSTSLTPYFQFNRRHFHFPTRLEKSLQALGWTLKSTPTLRPLCDIDFETTQLSTGFEQSVWEKALA